MPAVQIQIGKMNYSVREAIAYHIADIEEENECFKLRIAELEADKVAIWDAYITGKPPEVDVSDRMTQLLEARAAREGEEPPCSETMGEGGCDQPLTCAAHGGICQRNFQWRKERET